MSELANNINGEHFTLPATAAYWRVRRLREGRGAPEVVFGADGVPLLVPVEIDFESFRGSVDEQPGRYRLDALDEGRRPIEGIPAAYVAVPTRPTRTTEEPPPATATPPAPAPPATALPVHDALLAKVIDCNTQMVALMTERFSSVMESAAILIRAVDSAGVSHRPPPPAPAPAPPVAPPPSGRDGSYDPRNAGSYDPGELEPDAWDSDADPADDVPPASGVPAAMAAVTNVVGEVMPLVRMLLAHKMTGSRTGTPRNAAPAEPAPVEPAPAEPVSGPLSLAELRHLDAIDDALTPSEARRAQLAADDLPPRDRRDWFDTLCSLDVDDAVALIRTHIARAQGCPASDAADSTPNPGAARVPRARRPAPASPATHDAHPFQEDHHPADDDTGTDTPAPSNPIDPLDALTESPDEPDDLHEDGSDDAPACGHEPSGCDCEPEERLPCDHAPEACDCDADSPLEVTPEMIAHAMAVQTALTPDESTRVLALAADLADDERTAWMAELSTLSVADAVTALRAALAAMDSADPAALPVTASTPAMTAPTTPSLTLAPGAPESL